jgi:hydrogenase expression/formation protein HypC
MCLAVPARVERLFEDEVLGPCADADFGGALRTVSAAFVPEARVGDYLLVHAGCAISVLDEDAARQVLAELEALQQCR